MVFCLSVMAYCQMKNIKALMYICYTDTIFLDSPTMRAFIPLTGSTPIKDIIQVRMEVGVMFSCNSVVFFSDEISLNIK